MYDDFGQTPDAAADKVETYPSEELFDDEDDDDDDDDDTAATAELQRGWEPPVEDGDIFAGAGMDVGGMEEDGDGDSEGDAEGDSGEGDKYSSAGYFSQPTASSTRRDAELRAGTTKPWIEKYSDKYPGTRAGRVVKHVEVEVDGAESSSRNNIYTPFLSKTDWEVARWAKLRGPGSTAFSELLAIDGVSQFLISQRLQSDNPW
jgi:hypothetical protein